MHEVTQPAILYFGTPVVLISTMNEDESFNLAPMSSAWWLGQRCVLAPSAQAVVLGRIAGELERKFEVEIVHRSLVGDFAFCYPYLQNRAGNLVFCRIEVKDYIGSTRGTSFVSPFFHQS